MLADAMSPAVVPAIGCRAVSQNAGISFDEFVDDDHVIQYFQVEKQDRKPRNIRDFRVLMVVSVNSADPAASIDLDTWSCQYGAANSRIGAPAISSTAR
jgi:hypothetical protein